MSITREPWRCGHCKRTDDDMAPHETPGRWVSVCQHWVIAETHDDDGEPLTDYDQAANRHWCGEGDCEVIDICANCWSTR